jgi:hypothetical protein
LQLLGSPWQQQSTLPAPSGDIWAELAQRYPNDPLFVINAHSSVAHSSIGAGNDKDTKKQEKEIDSLIEKFPAQPRLYAHRLLQTLRWLKDDRRAGDFDNPNYPAPPPPINDKANFTEQELNLAIARARKGAKLDPQNAFFDWVLFQLLYAGHRDSEAIAALLNSTQKPVYNYYAFQSDKDLALLEHLRPLQLEEKLAVQFRIYYQNYPNSIFRNAAYAAAWQAVLAERSGEHARALRIYAAIWHVGRAMQNNAYSITESLGANSIQRVARNAWTYHTFGARSRRTEAQFLQGFQQYATKHGRGDLAAQAEQHEAERTKILAAIRAEIRRPGRFMDYPQWLLMAVGAPYALSVWGLLWLLFLLSSYVVACLAAHYLQRKWLLNHSSLLQSKSGYFFLPALLVIPLYLAVLPIFQGAFAPQNGAFSIGFTQWFYLVGSWYSEDSGYAKHLRAGTACCMLGIISIIAARGARHWQKEQMTSADVSPWRQYIAGWKENPWRALWPAEPWPAAAGLLNVLMTMSVTVAWILLGMETLSSDASEENVDLIWPVILTTATIVRAFWPWWKGKQRRVALWHGLNILRTQSLRLVTTLSVVYLVITLISLPYRTMLEQFVNERIEKGEFGVLREKMKLP